MTARSPLIIVGSKSDERLRPYQKQTSTVFVRLRFTTPACVRGRHSEQEITIFKSLGLAIEDVAAAQHFYETARKHSDRTRVFLTTSRSDIPDRSADFSRVFRSLIVLQVLQCRTQQPANRVRPNPGGAFHMAKKNSGAERLILPTLLRRSRSSPGLQSRCRK